MKWRDACLLACAVMLCVCGTACHRAPVLEQGYAGTWVMTVGQRVFYVVTVKADGGSFAGTLSAPEHWSTATGTAFSEITPKAITRSFARTAQTADALQMIIVNPADKSDEDEFQLRLVDADHATLTYVGVPFAPWPLVRSRATVQPVVASDWDPKASYSMELTPESPNAEMAAIYDEDQKERQSTDFPASMEKDDAQRRVRVRALLDAGHLKAGVDFRKAAFVFQHGTQPDDYLLAHTLALVALAKGDTEARWIATATLDRYLHSIGKAQIYGAGFTFTNGTVAPQEPFNRTLVSDALRQDLGVPALADQLDQFKAVMKAMQERAKTEK